MSHVGNRGHRGFPGGFPVKVITTPKNKMKRILDSINTLNFSHTAVSYCSLSFTLDYKIIIFLDGKDTFLIEWGRPNGVEYEYIENNSYFYKGVYSLFTNILKHHKKKLIRDEYDDLIIANK